MERYEEALKAIYDNPECKVKSWALYGLTGGERPEAKETAGQVPVAWLHKIKEPDMEAMQVFSWSDANPWSHWLSKHMEECSYSVTPLFTALQSPSNPTQSHNHRGDEQ